VNVLTAKKKLRSIILPHTEKKMTHGFQFFRTKFIEKENPSKQEQVQVSPFDRTKPYVRLPAVGPSLDPENFAKEQ
jgi:hypothetical protein